MGQAGRAGADLLVGVALAEHVEGPDRAVAADAADRQHRRRAHVQAFVGVAGELLEVAQRVLAAGLGVGHDRPLADLQVALVANDLFHQPLVVGVAAPTEDRDRLGAHVDVAVAGGRFAEEAGRVGVFVAAPGELAQHHRAQVRGLLVGVGALQQAEGVVVLGQEADQRGLERDVLVGGQDRADRLAGRVLGHAGQALGQEDLVRAVVEPEDHVLQRRDGQRAELTQASQQLGLALASLLEGHRVRVVRQQVQLEQVGELLEQPSHGGVVGRAGGHRRQLIFGRRRRGRVGLDRLELLDGLGLVGRLRLLVHRPHRVDRGRRVDVDRRPAGLGQHLPGGRGLAGDRLGRLLAHQQEHTATRAEHQQGAEQQRDRLAAAGLGRGLGGEVVEAAGRPLGLAAGRPLDLAGLALGGAALGLGRAGGLAARALGLAARARGRAALAARALDLARLALAARAFGLGAAGLAARPLALTRALTARRRA